MNDVRRRVLVVDDEPGMRYMARRVFQDRFDVLEAESGEQALRVLEEQGCHFALVDVRLPGLTGLELLTRIKLLRPEIDVIVMTGSTADPDEALEDSIRRKAFFFLRKPFPLSVLETLADRIVESQETSEALDRQMRRLQRDLEAAKKFQRRLLPAAEWQGHGVRVASFHFVSERLSGDFYDYWSLPGGEVAVLIADVMGHGPSAAMVTGIVKSQIQRSLAETRDPAEVLDQLDQELRRSQISGFVTAFLLVLAEADVYYCGAGHPAVMGRRGDGSPFQLDSQGIPVNTGFTVPPRRADRIELRPGDRLLLLTDGYTEGTDRAGSLFCESHVDGGTSPLFQATARALREPSPPAALRAFDAAWADYTGNPESDDDRAAVLVERVVAGDQGPGPVTAATSRL